jgi:hypothetical protein
MFLSLDLNKVQFAIRSFALGGQPYFEIEGATAERPEPIVEDIICGRLTPKILELFDGIDITGVVAMPCFVHDGRQAVSLKYTILLTLPESASPDFRLRHEKPLSDSVSYDDLMAIQVRPIDDTDV